MKKCWHCCEFGHEDKECQKEKKKLLCRYCGKFEDHESNECCYRMVVSMHFCLFCNKKGHFIGEKDLCDYYKREYKRVNENIEIIEMETATDKIRSEIHCSKTDVASSTLLMLKLTAPTGTNVTLLGEELYSKSVMDAYEKKKEKAIEVMGRASNGQNDKDDPVIIPNAGSIHEMNASNDIAPTGSGQTAINSSTPKLTQQHQSIISNLNGTQGEAPTGTGGPRASNH
jgi:hypothetical protein